MSFKHLLPTFRNRYRFVMDQVSAITSTKSCGHLLNLGTGEGDYDQALAKYADILTATDINEGDINVAKSINQSASNIRYEVKDALATGYEANTFDMIVCTEVIEHVGQPELLMKEIARILKQDGHLVMTFPSANFPFTYDPVNYVAGLSGKKMPFIQQGAYAFGHDYLIDYDEFCQLSTQYGFQIIASKPLGGYMIGLIEMYWTGLFQYFFKSNRININESNNNTLTIRPKTASVPALAFLTDFFLYLDKNLFLRKNHSIGMGVLLRKNCKDKENSI
ncbi:MAG: class I SAM-dependent methyltransferase [Saprospiraceae bacterium]|nr:class I SAM-dependent methyltransferase [Saprospiraceae bacterium]